MGVRAIRQTDQRSQEREKLAAAIENLRQLNAEIAAIKSAIATTEATARHGEEALKAANAQIQKAKVAAADAMVSRALGGSPAAPANISRLRMEAAAAQDEIDAATTALTHLRAKLGEAEHRIPFKRDAVEKAIPEIVRSSPELERLIRDFEAASQAYADLMHALYKGIPSEAFNERHVLPQPNTTLVNKWKAAIAALKDDADAALP
jgi:chromosome segregation ATPase